MVDKFSHTGYADDSKYFLKIQKSVKEVSKVFIRFQRFKGQNSIHQNIELEE